MKKIILSLVLFCGISVAGYSQKVYCSNSKIEAKVTVYVTPYKSNADLVVYKCNHTEARGNKGWWYFTKNYPDADIVIYFTENHPDADIVIYFTENHPEAGWRNEHKKHLFN